MSLNAVFSGLSGLVLFVGSPWVAGWLGVPTIVTATLGGALVGFAAVLIAVLATPHRLHAGARLVVAADLAWIIAAGLVIGLVPRALPATGDLALAGVTTVVALLVVGQLRGMARIGCESVTGTFPLELVADRLVAADPERVWAAISDAGGYADYVDGIADTTIVATYPWHYRMLLHEFSQTWEVEPAGDHTRLTLRFVGAVKLGVLGRLAVTVLRGRVPVDRILDGYERALVATAT